VRGIVAALSTAWAAPFLIVGGEPIVQSVDQLQAAEDAALAERARWEW
jgi:hypothetical protein